LTRTVRGGNIQLTERIIAIKGAGEMASVVAWRFYMANLRSIFMMETAMPLAVRREVSFCEAVHRGSKSVEGVEAVKAETVADIPRIWRRGKVAVIIDPERQTLDQIKADVVVDAERNQTRRHRSPWGGRFLLHDFGQSPRRCRVRAGSDLADLQHMKVA
jgi:hypothetical protein